MDTREVRRHNLKLLMDQAFGVGARGAQSRLAETLGKPQNFVSRCLADPGRAGAKTIGEDFAREIERSFGLQPYQLDKPMLGKDAASSEGPLKDSPDQHQTPTSKSGVERDTTTGTSYAVPVAAQVIARAFAAGELNASDIEELRRMALHLIKKNAQGAAAATELPEHLDGLAEAALKAAENGDNSEDLLKMVGHGLKKSQPKEGSKSDGKRKARNS